MSDNNITQDQLEPNVMEELESGIGDLSTLSTENKDSLVAAVTEIYGKNVIAEAIGEPLAVTDTFNEMGNEINSLLSSFKTNMMNSGVTVESGDKFKQLIEKIKGLTEGEGNKGVQFAQGNGKQISVSTMMDEGISVDIDFEPTFLFLAISNRNTPSYTSSSYHGGVGTLGVVAICIPDLTLTELSLTIGLGAAGNGSSSSYYYDIIFNTGLTDGKITIKENRVGTSWIYGSPAVDYDWYAIGVGEEDTTLRDSLASILEEEGVSVTEEDDMASLIIKVDEEFEDTKKTLAGLMQEGGYDITGEEDIDSLLELLTAQGITVNDVKQIACGYYHTVILKKDGSLWACGSNTYGQLGLGDDNSRTLFTQVTTNINNDVKQVACGYSFTVILKNDGTVWACGLNSMGQLGLNDTTDRTTFTQVTTNINNDVKQIACGYDFTFILKNDGSLWVCGDNDYGQLGLGTSDTDYYTSFAQVTTNIDNDVKEVICGDYHVFILKNDGSLWSCGYNQYSRLGLGDTDDRTTFTQVTTNINNDVKQVVCGEEFTLILKTNGSLWSCGRNDKGQLGLNDTTTRDVFTQVTIDVNNDVKQIACGNNHTIILKNDGSLWGCGSYFYGQLGIDAYNTTNGKKALVEIINKDIAILSVNCGGNVTFIVLNNGYVLSCGSNGNGQLGINSTSEVKPVFTMSTFKLF